MGNPPSVLPVPKVVQNGFRPSSVGIGDLVRMAAAAAVDGHWPPPIFGSTAPLGAVTRVHSFQRHAIIKPHLIGPPSVIVTSRGVETIDNALLFHPPETGVSLNTVSVSPSASPHYISSRRRHILDRRRRGSRRRERSLRLEFINDPGLPAYQKPE